MGRIFCLMGKSSSGKDTIYKELLNDKELNIKKIIPYTTRPIRECETYGSEYYFVNEKELQQLREKNVIIEERAYDTFYGVWKYFTVDDGQFDLKHQDYLMIATPDSFLSIQDYFGMEKTVPILIELDDGIRLERALNRERQEKSPRYEEMCRRFLADAKDFAPEKMEACGNVKHIWNDNLSQCIQKIKEYIEQSR